MNLVSSRCTRLDSLEYNVSKEWDKQGIKCKRILIAVSGGVDSIALLDVLESLKNKKEISLVVAYIYHQASLVNDSPQDEYRMHAYQLVKEVAEKKGLEFVSNKDQDIKIIKYCKEINDKSDEAELREYRHCWLKYLAKEKSCDAIAFGHHQEDLFETRLIRMIRGVGAKGLIGMKFYEKGEVSKLRPLLHTEKQEVLEYVKRKKSIFVEDPSNDDPRFLRNWLRKNWLIELEKYRPGAKKAFARSLNLLVESLQNEQSFVEKQIVGDVLLQDEEGYFVDRAGFFKLNGLMQRECLRMLLERADVAGFSHNHILEVIKRLCSGQKKGQKVFDFLVLGREWRVNAERFFII